VSEKTTYEARVLKSKNISKQNNNFCNYSYLKGINQCGVNYCGINFCGWGVKN